MAGLQAAGIRLCAPQSWKVSYMLLHLAGCLIILFSMGGTRGSNGGYHACLARALLTVPSSQTLQLPLYSAFKILAEQKIRTIDSDHKR